MRTTIRTMHIFIKMYRARTTSTCLRRQELMILRSLVIWMVCRIVIHLCRRRMERLWPCSSERETGMFMIACNTSCLLQTQTHSCAARRNRKTIKKVRAEDVHMQFVISHWNDVYTSSCRAEDSRSRTDGSYGPSIGDNRWREFRKTWDGDKCLQATPLVFCELCMINIWEIYTSCSWYLGVLVLYTASDRGGQFCIT